MASTSIYTEPDSSLVTITSVTYGLQALGLALGAFGAATVIGSLGYASLWDDETHLGRGLPPRLRSRRRSAGTCAWAPTLAGSAMRARPGIWRSTAPCWR